MSKRNNNIGSRVGQAVLGIVTKAAMAAAVAAGLGLWSQAFGAVADVQSLQTQYTAGTATSVTHVSGYGTSQTGFAGSNFYTINYAGGDLAITQINTATASYVPSAQGMAVVRRNTSGPNTDILWYATSGNINTANGSTLNLEGPQESGYNQAFSGNNLLVGADNIFGNTGNTAANNNTDVERVDMLYNGGVQANSNNVFTIIDRGEVGQHDGFKIAAITSLDQSGNPASYGPLLTLTLGSWGNTPLLAEEGYTVLRTNNSGTDAGTYHPSDKVVQTMGGVVVPTTDLAASGSTIYGYSLFGVDTTGTGSQLVDWTNSTYFPTNTSAITTGGLDPIAVTGVLYTMVPEPTTASLVLIGAAGLLGRRGKRKA